MTTHHRRAVSSAIDPENQEYAKLDGEPVTAELVSQEVGRVLIVQTTAEDSNNSSCCRTTANIYVFMP